jgi:hypothetical protein
MPDVRSGLDPKDYRYINPNPDPLFSPERNRAVVEETIRDTEKYFDVFRTAKDEDLENRVDILSSYARYRFNKGTKQIEEYVGKDLMNKLIGERLLSKIRVADSVNRLSKKTFKERILL